MGACDFKNTDKFKRLAKQVSDPLAVDTWVAYENAGIPLEIPTLTELKRKLGLYKLTNYSQLELSLLGKRIRRYNTINGNAHRFIRKQQGKSGVFDIEFQPNYLPVNVEMQRERDSRRSEEGKTFSNITVEGPQDIGGIFEVAPEEQVLILGENQYEVAGEIYPSYQDAIDAAEKNEEESRVGEQLQRDIDNLTNSWILRDHFSQFSAKSRDAFDKAFTAKINRLRPNQGSLSREFIISELKCI